MGPVVGGRIDDPFVHREKVKQRNRNAARTIFFLSDAKLNEVIANAVTALLH